MEVIKRKKKTLKAAVTRLENKAESKLSEGNIVEFECLLEWCDEVSQKVKELLEELCNISEIGEEEFEFMQEEILDVQQRIQIQVVDLKSRMKMLSNVSLTDQQVVVASDKSKVKLPVLELPSFSGELVEWMKFKETFDTTIHTNSQLSDVEKLQYLRSMVKGSALSVIKGIPITDQGYEEAWKLLERRFDNHKEIVYTHLEKLLNQPVITTESSVYLRRLIDTTHEILGALKILKLPVDHWDAFLVFSLKKKLDPETSRNWELNNQNKELPSMSSFMQFLEGRATSLIAMNHKKVLATSKLGTIERPKVTPGRTTSYQALVPVLGKKACPCCKGEHALYACPDFLKLTVPQRKEFLRSQKRCFNCLKDTHWQRQCTASACRICQRKHNSLLHIETDNSDSTVNPELEIVHNCISITNQTILPTAFIKVRNAWGQGIRCRALLDTGSQTSFVTSDCVQKLQLKKNPGELPFYGITASKLNRAKGFVHLSITLDSEPGDLVIKTFVMPKIIGKLPRVNGIIAQDCEIRGQQLADPYFMSPGNIDILLGADVLSRIVNGKTKNLVRNYPNVVLLGSVFGWVIMGQTETSADIPPINHFACCDINNTLRQFWELEDIPDPESREAVVNKCENFFRSTYSRNEHGRYIVKLPFATEDKCFPSSRKVAVRRLKQVEFKLRRNAMLNQHYQKFMIDYLQAGHMEAIPSNEMDMDDYNCCYLPHHAVNIHTKFRVVFDASVKYENQCSLNDSLLIGPTIQDSLFTLLLRFRLYPIAITADIVKMYRQVLMAKEDADFQRIVWRQSPELPIQDFRLLTITYGTSSAPFLATRCLTQLASDEGHEFPQAVRALRDFYMDDLLTGAQTVQEAIQLKDELLTMLERGGFQLRKWASNSPAVLQSIPNEWYHTESLTFDYDTIIKTLGVRWNPNRDQFMFHLETPLRNDRITKRIMLSHIARIFDPLGWLSPITVVAKILLQELWKYKLNWDQDLPPELESKWFNYSKGLNETEQITVPRFMVTNPHSVCKLVGFSDASLKAYATCIYILSPANETRCKIHLVAAKTKVSPVKSITLPRLELSAAWLLTRLMDSVKRALDIKSLECYAFTDSKIVLSWLASPSNRWKPFVAQRVSKIQQRLPSNRWYYVKSSENPADCATRGVSSHGLLHHDLWWSGPKCLADSDFFINHDNVNITDITEEEETLLEEKNQEAISVNLQIINNCDSDNCEIKKDALWFKYSSLSKLRRIVAYCLRFIHNAKSTVTLRRSGFLTSQELMNSLYVCVRLIQTEAFSFEITCLTSQKVLSNRSKVISLNPFMDKGGLLRVGGRLYNARISSDRKHPILLPKKHPFTYLIVDYFHRKFLHAGPQLLQAVIQNHFWIISIRDAIKSYLRKCITCIRQKSQIIHQQMGNLPTTRINPARPFLHCGVDYAGPFTLRVVKHGRGQKTFKGYMALFICFVTRAIHLEAVSDLSTESFIASLKRFIARRGICRTIISDCGTNFVGASRELKSFLQLVNSHQHNESIHKFLAEEGITWTFNPPAAPHMGGLWEAGIKSAKYHLRRIMGNVILNYEEFSTILAQVEACLNSRPISHISSDPNDLTPLTPAHFLIGDSLTAIPEPDYTTLKDSHLSRWQLTQKIVPHFWKRWSQEYLSRLQHRPKWWISKSNIDIGDLVLLKEPSLPPLKWHLGRVVDVFPGDDNLVRVVLVKTSTGMVKRHVSKLMLLPFNQKVVSSPQNDVSAPS